MTSHFLQFQPGRTTVLVLKRTHGTHCPLHTRTSLAPMMTASRNIDGSLPESEVDGFAGVETDSGGAISMELASVRANGDRDG